MIFFLQKLSCVSEKKNVLKMGTNHYNWRIAGIVVGVLALIYSASISFYAFEFELLINHARYLIIYLSVIGKSPFKLNTIFGVRFLLKAFLAH